MLRAVLQVFLVAMQTWKGYLPSSPMWPYCRLILFQPLNSRSAYGRWDHMWTLSHTHSISTHTRAHRHTLTHTGTHPRGISRLLPSWFTLVHKTHTVTQLTTIEGGLLWNWNNSTVLVWRGKLALCFCLCVSFMFYYAAFCLCCKHLQRGFGRSDMLPTSCQFDLSYSLLCITLAAWDSHAKFVKLSLLIIWAWW